MANSGWRCVSVHRIGTGAILLTARETPPVILPGSLVPRRGRPERSPGLAAGTVPDTNRQNLHLIAVFWGCPPFRVSTARLVIGLNCRTYSHRPRHPPALSDACCIGKALHQRAERDRSWMRRGAELRTCYPPGAPIDPSSLMPSP